MNPLRVLAAATAMELCALAVLLAACGALGWRHAWLDVINSFAPMIVVLALVGAGLALASMPAGLARTTSLVLALLAVGYGAAMMAPDLVHRFARAPAQGGASFRLLSANVWSDNPTPGAAVEDILRRDVDAVLLQEADGSLAGALGLMKQRYPYSSAGPRLGVQIYAKAPMIAHGCEVDRGADLKWAWLTIKLADNRTVTLATTHLGWPFPPGLQARQRDALATAMGRFAPSELILAGDFNTTPWSFAMRHQDKALAPLTRLTRAWLSWPARIDPLARAWAAPVLPIDHIYAGSNWNLVKMTRVRIAGSDHFATEVELSLSSTPRGSL